MHTLRPDAARIAVMGGNDDDEAQARREQGAGFTRRRHALGLANINQIYIAMREDGKRIDRSTLTKAERGDVTQDKMDEIDTWLTQQEKENGVEPGGVIRLTFHGLRSGVVTVDDVIFEAPVDHPDELGEAVSKLLDRFEQRPGQA